MRIKHPEKRKNLLNINSQAPKALKELLQIRGDSITIKEEFDTFKDSDKSIKLMKKKKAAFFISSHLNTHLNVGRIYDGEFLELIRFKILKNLSSADFSTIPSEQFVKYYLILHNIQNKRLENFFVDLFHQRSKEANLNGIKYAWIFSYSNDTYTLKFVRVLNDLSVEDIGPFFEMKIENEFYCNEEMLQKATKSHKKASNKNVTTNKLHEKIGTLHVDKQDLKDIKLKKNRVRKNKEVNEDPEKTRPIKLKTKKTA